MTTTKTTVVLEAQAKGFEKTSRDVKKTFDALDPTDHTAGFKKLDYAVGQMVRQVRGLTEGLKQANQQLRAGGDGGAFKRMTEDVRASSEAVDELKKKEDELKKKREQDKKSFRMGVLQGARVGEYFPEGGLSRNAAGRAVGGTARAGISAPAGGLFSGASGFAGGFNSIPVVGGFIASQLQNMFATAQEYYGFSQARGAINPRMAGIYNLKDPETGVSSLRFGQLGTRDLLAGATSSFGVNKTAVAQMIGEMLQTSGGLTAEGTTQSDKGLVEAMLGASKFGVGAGTVGQILRSERQGGIVIDKDEVQTSTTMDAAFATAMRIGLDSSEMINAIASSMQDGVRFDAGSLMELTERFNARGLSAESALAAAQGMQRAGMNMAAQGPKTGAEFHAMRTLFGYGDNGDFSARSYWDAKKNAREGNVTKEGVDRLLDPVMRSSMSESGKMIAAQGILQKLGVDMSETDIEALMKEDATQRVENIRARYAAKKDVGMPTIGEAGKQVTESAAVARSATEDIRIGTGARMIEAVENFERSQANAVGGLAKMLGPVATEVSALIRKLSETNFVETVLNAATK